MAFDAHSNLGYSTVAVAPVPPLAGLSLTVQAGQGALFPAAPFNCTVWPAGVAPLASNAEIVRVTAVVGDVLTIVRAQEGSAVVAIDVGHQIANTTSVKVFTDIEANVTTNTADIATLQATKQPLDAALTDLSNAALVQGDIIYQNATNLVRLPAGVAGQILETAGPAANPSWVNPPSGGGDLLAANNLSDVANVTTSQQNLGVEPGVDVQTQSALLQDISSETFAQGDIIYYNGTNLVNLGPGTSGQFLRTQGAGANPQWAAAGGGGSVVVVVKSADQTVTNNATPQDDSELLVAVSANTYYRLEFYILYSGNNTTGDYQSNFLLPALANIVQATGSYTTYNATVAGVAMVTTFAASTTVWPNANMICGVDPAGTFMLLTGWMDFYNTNAGTVTYRFSNVSAAAGRDSITRAGSILRLQPLATA